MHPNSRTSHGTQNAHLTFKGNIGVGRHGWLRLTPAYSVRLVREHVAALPAGAVVTDPFSGTGTTALAAAEHGCRGQALDINPFLVWLGNAKLRRYPAEQLAVARTAGRAVAAAARGRLGDGRLWRPGLRNIERWWDAGALAALAAVRACIDAGDWDPDVRDLLDLALCRTLIDASNAAFNHQSMSFRAGAHPAAARDRERAEIVLDRFAAESGDIIDVAARPLPGTGATVAGDARLLDGPALEPCDLLFTSPPYANRMSYIRELRPYMYWLRFLDDARDAGDLDWRAIGGTWGAATSNLRQWAPVREMPLTAEIEAVRSLVIRDGGRHGPLLANYVHKYFADMWAHFGAAFKHVKSGGRATYVIGNSTFYGHLVPSEQWYGAMLREAGFVDVGITPIRKRNSNRVLFEYAVTAVRP